MKLQKLRRWNSCTFCSITRDWETKRVRIQSHPVLIVGVEKVAAARHLSLSSNKDFSDLNFVILIDSSGKWNRDFMEWVLTTLCLVISRKSAFNHTSPPRPLRASLIALPITSQDPSILLLIHLTPKVRWSPTRLFKTNNCGWKLKTVGAGSRQASRTKSPRSRI